MPTPVSTAPTKAYAAHRQLFKNAETGEYCILVPVQGRKNKRWLSTGTTDREEAMRRIERTGVGQVVAVAEDERFRERAVEILTKKDRVLLTKLVDDWLADQSQRVSPESMTHPRVITGQLLALYDSNASLDQITVVRLNSWINTAPSMTRRRRRMSVLSALFQFAFDTGMMKVNIGPRLGMNTSDLTFEQMERDVKDPFTQEEYERLVAKATGFWLYAVQLSWWLGLRFSDCCKLQWGSFCAVPGKLVVWQSKTRRRMELDLADPLLGGGTIPKIVEQMRQNAKDAVYCFPEVKDVYVSKSRPRLIDQFRALCVESGVDGSKTFHSLRKSAALRWQAAGRSLDEIGELLGHTGSENAKFYVETPSK